MAIYLKYGSVKGDATQQNHKDWIMVDSIQFGVGRAISTPVGQAVNREASEPSLSEVTLTKSFDVSSHELFGLSLVGIKGDKATIDFASTNAGGQNVMQIVLYEAVVSSYSFSSGGDAASESFSLNFTKIEYNASPLDVDNKPRGPFKKAYDLATAKAS
ncbi:MAG: Hcp family type VI secretion system effector [Maricaulaceae bacterium]